MLNNAIHEVDNPALAGITCTPDYFQSLTPNCLELLESSLSVDKSHSSQLIILAFNLSHFHSIVILQGKAVSNTSPDITFGEQMAEACKQLGSYILKILNRLKSECSTNYEKGDNLMGKDECFRKEVGEAKDKLLALVALVEQMSGSLRSENPEALADMIEDEMAGMAKAIEEAAAKIQDMLSKSRAADSGIKLEVNGKILDSCTTLMQAIRLLVEKSRLLQGEIVLQGKVRILTFLFLKR